MNYIGALKSAPREAAAVFTVALASSFASKTVHLVNRLATQALSKISATVGLNGVGSAVFGLLAEEKQKLIGDVYMSFGRAVLINEDGFGFVDTAKKAGISALATSVAVLAAYKLSRNSQVMNAAVGYLGQGFRFVASKI
jgi:hypothetical protein